MFQALGQHVSGSACALQTIAQREVAALLGINSGRDAQAKKRRKQNIIVQVTLLTHHCTGSITDHH